MGEGTIDGNLKKGSFNLSLVGIFCFLPSERGGDSSWLVDRDDDLRKGESAKPVSVTGRKERLFPGGWCLTKTGWVSPVSVPCRHGR